MLQPIIQKNDKRAKIFIYTVSILLFLAIVVLDRVELKTDFGFDVHIFATINACINSTVAMLLVLGLLAVKQGKYQRHKNTMLAAIILSALFLISYVCHHLLAGDTRFGGEGAIRYVYYFILITHIFLAAVILPFILYTAYRAATAQWPQHRRLARITWPIWFYVSVSGVTVYLMISPYY